MPMLPNEHQPLELTKRQQEVHQRYTSMGFRICARPFAARGDHLWFFMSLPTPEDSRGIEFTINLQSGIAHRTGTQTTYEMDAAEEQFGRKTEAIAAAVDPAPVKEDRTKTEQQPVAARPIAAKPATPKKKQTALF
jgi:uncharacterized protein with GYD domain